MMLSFRKKILLSDIVLFLVFIALLFPFVGKTVGNIVRKTLEEQAITLIREVQNAEDQADLIKQLKQQQILVFFRVSLGDEKGQILYDSHVQRLYKEGFSPKYVTSHPEVEQALRYGVGYSEGYSHLFSQTFVYVAKAFHSHGKKYILRTAFPMKEINDLTDDFEIGFLSLGGIILLLYSLMTWAIIHRLSSPIQQIINSIKSHQEGKEEFLPQVNLGPTMDHNDDFGRLANTLNSMSKKIQKQIEILTNQRNETKSILDSLIEGVLSLDENNTITYINLRACKMLNLSYHEMIGASFFEIQNNQSTLLEKCKELVFEGKKKGEIVSDSLILGDVRTMYIDIIAIPRPVENGILLVFQDKTSDYKILQVGKDFIANASHELRTPITIVRGFAETLQDIPDLTPEMLREITEKMIKTCERLNYLVKNLLMLADVENLDVSTFQEVDLAILIENAKMMILAMHNNTRVVIERKKENLLGFVDPALMDLAIMNLLENAVKYSEGIPEIFITLTKRSDHIFIHIEDHGIGIPPQDLEHIFDRFYTVDKARSRRRGGAGLGLSIVKTIIEKHGGKISVSSQIRTGTTFMICLPIHTHCPLQKTT